MSDKDTNALRSFASVIPLNYSETRVEHTVIYCSNDWEQLVELLADPAEFFTNRQKEFTIAGDPVLPWRFHSRSPITAIVQPGARFRPNLRRLEGLFARKSSKLLVGPDAQQMMRLAFRTGAFVAEFAICTGILIVHYWPPAVPKGPRFKKGFTPATLGLVHGPTSSPVGTLHFDLEAPKEDPLTKYDHARLAVDCLESRDEMVRGFNKRDDFEHGVVQLTNKGGTITVPASPDPVQGPKGTSGRFALKSIGRRMKVRSFKHDLPTLIMDGLSSGVDGILCCNISVNFEGDDRITMHETMILKTYMSEADRAKDCPPPGTG